MRLWGILNYGNDTIKDGMGGTDKGELFTNEFTKE